MAKGLEGKTIVIAGSKIPQDMAEVIERRGGTALVRSLQGLTPADPSEIERDVRQFAEQEFDWVIFTTGIGYEAVYAAAERLGLAGEFVEKLKGAKVACRGYRTNALLKKSGIHPAVSADDGTIANMIDKLQLFDFDGCRVWLQLHGELTAQIHQFIESQPGMKTQAMLPYRYQAPERETLAQLTEELFQRQVDAVCFTTQLQVNYLFDYAQETGREAELKEAFEHHVLAAAVGKVTADALRGRGVERMAVPEVERMGAMIVEIGRFFE
ncbi:uroporphyrinogen-III synthase [Saccharibacillus alkalitolerans]|uniref:Uroporphyrinogen-III synthase n=1 Tax=Saccharibacillus alkalitolerans TaxID=2705290 RepID=A0ABX0F2J9_9BACL|nr:uroporphyrinogen-III synthase [Saccharibacillus alkalitolerans]NGZ74593.1 uroporphyrinogen-III synthase [Saccharibacillus alkalitolerans]